MIRDSRMVASGDGRDHGLEAAIVREVRACARVVLLSDDPDVRRTLLAARCEVFPDGLTASTPDPATLDGLRRFDPDLIVATDLAAARPAMRSLLDAAPRSRLFVALWNSSSSRWLLSLLRGTQPPESGVPDQQANEWFREWDLRIVRRDAETAAPTATFTPDLDARLSALFGQINASAGADRLYYLLERGASPRSLELDDRLLSVIIRNHSLSRLHLLDHAIFSLACQRYTPLEIVVVSQCYEEGVIEELTALLEKHRAIGGYSFQVIHEPWKSDIRSRLLNIGLHKGRGRYVAFLDDDDVVYPQHYEQLVQALRDGEDAWAFSRARRAWMTCLDDGELFCTAKLDVFDRTEYDHGALISDNYITCHSYVVDRKRLGPFPLSFPEAFVQLEDYVLLLHLLALYKPSFVAGPSTCEYRIRNDGSNTVIESALPEHQAAVRHRWNLARAAAQAVKHQVQTVVSLQELEQAMTAARAAVPPKQDAPRGPNRIDPALERLPLVGRVIKLLGLP